MAVESGRVLSHYRLVERIGQGGMGEVWRATDTRLGREVALKFLPAEVANHPERLQRFEREARAVAALNHPNIVTVHSVEYVGGERFIAMELLKGKTLAKVIPPHGLTLGRFFDLAIPLADALSAAHQHGITHRDLKPSNIMVSGEGRLKILDFGLVKTGGAAAVEEASKSSTASVGFVTGEGRVLGTVPYMSPEQFKGRVADHRSDLFALGIILHEMATGRHPFRGETQADLISSILRDTPPPLAEIRSDLPNHLGRLIRHCLEKNPEHRCQTAKDLRNELEDLKNEVASGDMLRAASARPRTALPVRTIAAAALGVVLAALGLLFWPGPSAEDGPTILAVPPFINMTGDPDQEYISQGIAAGLITELSEIAGVRVVGRAAAWGRAAKDESPADLARRLGVASLLEGEVQQQADRLRVNVKLTDADSGLILWSEIFEGAREGIVALQKEIAHHLTAVLSIPLSPRERRRLARDPTRSFKAYDFFLRGRQHLEDGAEPLCADLAIEMLRQAIRVDPEFALAHADLSKALWKSHRRDPDTDKLAEAEREALIALEIDPELPAAQVALARVYRSTGRLDESIAKLRSALANHPKPDEAHLELAWSYEVAGDLEEAETCLRAAATLGGEVWFNWNQLGAFLERSGRYDEAREAFERAAERAPEGISRPLANIAALTIQEGRFDEAVAAYEKIARPIRDPILASNIGTAYYFSNRPDKWDQAEEYYRLAIRLNPRKAAFRRNLADLHQHLGRHEEARHHYREALLLIDEQLEINPENKLLQLSRALYAAKAEECATALPAAEALAAELPETARNMHRLAVVFVLCGQDAAALEHIRLAIRLGFSGRMMLQEDEFKSLRSNPDFQALTATKAQ